MVPAISRAPSRRFAGFLGALALVALLAPTARAADPAKSDNALQIIPDDAAFYSSSLRIKEQIDAIAKSNAWAKIWAMPSVQQGWKMLENEYKPGGKLAPVQAFFAQEENKDLLSLLADAGSHEIFCYGGEDWPGLLELAQHMMSAMQYGPIKAQLTGNANGRDASQLQALSVLRVLAKNQAALKVPDLVFGAKLTDVPRAEKQLKRLEALLEKAAAQVPELKGRVKRVTINDGSFITLTFDGAMVPWDDIPWKMLEDKPGEFAPLVRKLKSMTVTLSVGVQHGYLMVSIGGTTDQLAKVGGAGPKLATRSELKPLAKFADRKLVSVGYVSKALMARVAGGGQNIEPLIDLAKVALPKSNMPEEQQKRILKDLADLSRELNTGLSEMGAIVGVTFLTDRGYESYSYNYSKNPQIDGSKPLTLLNHVGGDPILAAVSRSKVSGNGYKTFVKWVKIFYGHADEYARANLNGDPKDQYVKVTEKLLPLFKRLDETTAKQLIPALADGQSGFVFDAKWSSKQWLKALPATEKAMPLPEIGIVLGVSDSAKLVKAMTDYRETINDMLGAARAVSDAAGAIGDFRIPPPESVKRPSGTLYFYTLPELLGVEPKVVPTAGLSAKVAALALSKEYAERLLKATPLKVDGGPLADLKKPLSSALYFNWPAFVNAATPWVEYGANLIIDEHFGADAPKKTRADILAQVNTVLEVMKVYRGSTSATYLEDGVIVTHSESIIKDLAK